VEKEEQGAVEKRPEEMALKETKLGQHTRASATAEAGSVGGK